MSILIGCLYVVEVVVCVLLVLIVMLQKPKEGGLNTALSGGMGEAVFGADAGNVLVRTTVVLGTVFLLNTIALARLTATVQSRSIVAGEAPAAAQAPAELPDLTQAPVAAPEAPKPAGK